MKNKVMKVVLTGGPCAGKSVAMGLLKEKLSAMGFNVITIEEGATAFMANGFHPARMPEKEFQIHNIKRQLMQEDIFEDCAKYVKAPSIMLCDRGPLDSKAYAGGMFEDIMAALGTNEQELRNRYNLVVFLNTMACLGEEMYGKQNNEHRRENYEEALVSNQRTLDAWVGHPKLRVIKSSEDFKADISPKIDRIMEEICNHMGKPMPLEIERKFLVRKPDIDALKKKTKITESLIYQTYLKSPDDTEMRVRKEVSGGATAYYLTKKIPHGKVSRYEKEEIITEGEYNHLKNFADPKLAEIVKRRYYFVYQDQSFELDVYPFFKENAILEIELDNENNKVEIPEFLSVIREVSTEPAYKNAGIARLVQLAKQNAKTAMSCPQMG